MDADLRQLTIATSDGRERYIAETDFDIQVGRDTNSFVVQMQYVEGGELPAMGQRVFIPYTEYGGPVGEIRSSTITGTVEICGLTWRGLLKRKIIQPDKGKAYYTVSGSVLTILRNLITRLGIGAYFVADPSIEAETGSFSFDRYTDAESDIRKLLKHIGLKMTLTYDPEQQRVVIGAAEVTNYSAEVEMSTDGELNIETTQIRNGVNHLICLGQGELAKRLVTHLYTNAAGTISTTQSLFREQEIAAVFEDNGADTIAKLQDGGRKRLQEICNRVLFSADVERTSKDLLIDDIISGVDYVTGLRVATPITGVICQSTDGAVSVEYTLQED